MAEINPERVRLSKSCIGPDEKNAVCDVLDKGYLGMGTYVAEFENDLTEYFSRPTVCVSSGTAALQLALEAVDIGPGDEVLVQSMTYVATFQAISATGARPIACEVKPTTMTLDCQDAERRLTPRTKAVMPMHYSGGVGDLNELYQFAAKYKLRVIEDAAHAFGTIYRNNRIGSIGDIVCFSFDGIKNITCGEGGCVVSSDQRVIQRVKDARLLGVKYDSENRYKGKRSWNFDVDRKGWRYHMSNINAAIGLTQLRKFRDLEGKRKYLANYYKESLSKVDGVTLIDLDYKYVVPHIFPVILRSHEKREILRDALERSNIETGLHYQPGHLLTFYSMRNTSLPLKTTEDLFRRILTLPLHPDLELEDVRKIIEVVQSCVGSKPQN